MYVCRYIYRSNCIHSLEMLHYRFSALSAQCHVHSLAIALHSPITPPIIGYMEVVFTLA